MMFKRLQQSKHWHWLWRSALILVIIVGLAGLVYLPVSSKAKPARIIAICKAPATQISFWWSLKSGLEAAAREFNVMVEYRSPVDESHVADQITLLNQAIAEKPDAIILAALDKQLLAEPAKAVQEAGIPLIMVDSKIESQGKPPYDSFIATDNVAAGEKLGNLVLDQLPAGKKLVIVSASTRGDSLIDREAGLRNILKDRYEILPTVDAQGASSDEIFRRITDLLTQDAGIGGVVCLNEYTTAGSARAIRGTGKTRVVQLFGFDSSEELINYLEEGLLSAVVIQRPFNMGYMSVAKAVDVLAGHPVDLFFDTGSIVITKDTLYEEENEKLLFPFE